MQTNPQNRSLVVLLVAIIVVVIVIVSVVAWYTVLSPRPKITMTDVVPTNAVPRCGVFIHNPQSVGAQFTLVNTGNADGFAIVNMNGGATPLAQNTYFVPAGQSVTKTLFTDVDCSSSYTVSVWISQVNPS
jgi:hypothetical protein